MAMHTRLLAACVSCAALLLCSAAVTAQEAAKTARHVRSALGTGAAVAPDGTLWLVGLDAEARLFAQTSPDLGATWNPPRLLDISGDKISADGENRPKIAFGPQGRVVIAYTQPLAKPNTGEVRLLRSADGGASFSTPATIHQDRQVITHRFESIAFDGTGTLHAVWIDKRDLTAAMGSAGEAGGKSKLYRGAAIYRNESRDGGASFGPDTKVADHSCECCRIALASSADGGVVAMWRHVFAPNIRDHAFTRLGQVNIEPKRASFDGWQLDGCPHHGPALSLTPQGGYHAVWFGDRVGTAAVRYGQLAADGTPQGAVRELPDPRAEHADIASRGEQVAIAWRSFDGAQTRLRAWVSADAGASFTLRELAASAEQNDFPRLLVTPQDIRVLWRTAKETHVLPIQP